MVFAQMNGGVAVVIAVAAVVNAIICCLVVHFSGALKSHFDIRYRRMEKKEEKVQFPVLSIALSQ